MQTLRKAAHANGRIPGLEVCGFLDYALTLDLVEPELADALAAGLPAKPGALPLRDRYLPDLAAVLDVECRMCAGATFTNGKWHGR